MTNRNTDRQIWLIILELLTGLVQTVLVVYVYEPAEGQSVGYNE